MIALALDIGGARTGIAVSDRTGSVAMPLKVLPAVEVEQVSRSFRYILEDHEPDIIVCGLPQTMAGEEGTQAECIRAIAAKIGARTGLPIEFVDERLSSRDAKRILREQGLNEKRMRGKVDMISASLFLQVWLDARKEESQHGE